MPQNGNLQSLPAEIKLKVLQLLSLRDLRTVNRVSRDLREATNDPRLWRSLTLILTSRTWPDFREIIRLQKLKLITSVKFEQNISSKKADETLRQVNCVNILVSAHSSYLGTNSNFVGWSLGFGTKDLGPGLLVGWWVNQL